MRLRGAHQLLIGDNRRTLATIAPGSVQCAVTSPPYFALRSYLPKDHPNKPLELGSERTIEEYIAAQLEVFRLVRTALHPTGTLWVNIGDAYADDSKWGGKTGGKHVKALHGEPIGREKNNTGLKAGDQQLVPFRFALAMQADGWTLRDTIIWSKPSPMPISVAGWRWVRCRVKVANGTMRAPSDATHRPKLPINGTGYNWEAGAGATATWQPCPGCPKCTPNGGYVLRRGKWRTTTSFEYVFMFAKSEKYFCDGDAVQEEASESGRKTSFGKLHGDGRQVATNGKRTGNEALGVKYQTLETRNPRSVWTIPSEALREKHYAAYPSELVRRIILAATSEAGCCPTCRTPYAPVVESERVATRPGEKTKVKKPSGWDTSYGTHGTIHRNGRGEPEYTNLLLPSEEVGNRDPQRHIAVSRITGYRPSCGCDAGDPIPCVVLDPYAGSGTTLQVASWYGRDSIGCELNEEYAAIAERRIAKPPRCMIRERKREGKPEINVEADDGLFAMPKHEEAPAA